MRCLECNRILTDAEAIYKNAKGEYTDTCFRCLFGKAEVAEEDMDDEYYDSDVEEVAGYVHPDHLTTYDKLD